MITQKVHRNPSNTGTRRPIPLDTPAPASDFRSTDISAEHDSTKVVTK